MLKYFSVPSSLPLFSSVTTITCRFGDLMLSHRPMRLFLFLFVGFLNALLRYNWHTRKCTCLKYTIWYVWHLTHEIMSRIKKQFLVPLATPPPDSPWHFPPHHQEKTLLDYFPFSRIFHNLWLLHTHTHACTHTCTYIMTWTFLGLASFNQSNYFEIHSCISSSLQFIAN